MKREALISGGGIGGLAAALALGRADWRVRLYERAAAFTPVGAGVQLGPNVTRVLQHWGLGRGLQEWAAFPDRLEVRDASSAKVLGQLALGERARQTYGAPYATMHRADLHGLLLGEVQRSGDFQMRLGAELVSCLQDEHGVTVSGLSQGARAPTGSDRGELLVVADGLWSQLRQRLLHDGPPQPTGHLAYRTLLHQAALPLALRSQQVTVWLGPHLHVVDYPVRGGEARNLVVFLEGEAPMDAQSWDHQAHAARLQSAISGQARPLRDLIDAATDATTDALPSAGAGWRLWALSDRMPMAAARQHAVGRVALLGDAAHPMLPYLAQGAGMAIEDAACLQQALTRDRQKVSSALAAYAADRWQRNARVQARSRRNGQIFHAAGPLRWGRNAALGVFGAKLLDMPWLYGFDVTASPKPAP